MCDRIAKLRKQLQRHANTKLIFLDETALRISAAPTSTLVAPGETYYVVVDDTTQYAARYDMIACCTVDQVFPPVIFSVDDRKERKAKGVNKEMLLKYIHDILGQSLGAINLYPLILVLDRATIHKKGILEAFHENNCQDMQKVILMPTQAAKRMSPLDNSLFHTWKERCRNRTKITKSNIVQIMADEWNKLTKNDIAPMYRHCGLMRRTDPYFDCPQPHVHKHSWHVPKQ